VPEATLVVGAVVGAAGLLPVARALHAGKHVALANKEALVMAGRLMTAAARRSGARILPVDSEHNALFQCLDGQPHRAVRRLVLTASGGPFRSWPRERMDRATVDEALAHPTWRMGPKITIDSASLMNKGLEVIEAHFLFDMPADRIDVVVHPTSIVHSMVEFEDGSVLAQLGTADMRIPIRYALSYPERWPGEDELRLDLLAAGPIEFFAPDRERFPCLGLAYAALAAATSARVTLNAANEVAVAAFLEGRIPFGAIAENVAAALDADAGREPGSIEEVVAMDAEARRAAAERLSRGMPLSVGGSGR
jgi:1-deoxy-D-xylulose-5-phosphate reductoisomerase